MGEYACCLPVAAIIIAAFAHRKRAKESRLWQLLSRFDAALDRLLGLKYEEVDEIGP